MKKRPESNAKPTEISPVTFVELSATGDVARLEIVLPSTLRVCVRPGFDASTLARILDVLEARR